jgi:hypothetical protein
MRLLYGLRLRSFAAAIRVGLTGFGERDIRPACFALVADLESLRPFCRLLLLKVDCDRLSIASSILLVLRPLSPGDFSLRLLLVFLSPLYRAELSSRESALERLLRFRSKLDSPKGPLSSN